MKTYTYSNGLTIRPRMQPCGTFTAMDEIHIEEEKVFDVYWHGRFIATAKTWEQAKDRFAALSRNKGSVQILREKN